MPSVEPTGVHHVRPSVSGRGSESQNNNGDLSKPSTSTNDSADASTNNNSGQSQQVGNNSNQSSNVNAGFIQNRPQGKNIFLQLKFHNLVLREFNMNLLLKIYLNL